MTTTTTPAHFTLREVLEALRAAGITNAEPSRLNRLMLMGKLPRPQKDGSGRLLYDREWIEAAHDVLEKMPSHRMQVLNDGR